VKINRKIVAIAAGVAAGATPVVDGRGAVVKGYDHGHFLRPTVLAGVDPGGMPAASHRGRHRAVLS